MRYHVDTPARLVLVQVALDQAFGLRDAAGNPTPREQLATQDGGRTYVPASALLGPAHDHYDHPGTHWLLIQGDDGTAALEIAESPRIDERLGTTVSGVPLPRATDLVAEAALPARVRAEIERRRAQAGLEQAMGIGGGR